MLKSADPRSGVLELFEMGEVYRPLPPPPWALRRKPLAPIGVKTFYIRILGSNFGPWGPNPATRGYRALWVQFWLL